MIQKQKELCERFLQEKEELYKEKDPERLKEASVSYYVRHWDLSSEVNEQKLRKTLQKNIKDHFEKAKLFLRGENIDKILEEFGIVTQNCPLQLFRKAQTLNIMKEQWDMILQFPLFQNLKCLKDSTLRLTMSPNDETGCEQSNSKFNRAKNKFSSTMSVEVIQARMRTGSNGPPVHLFRPAEYVKCWKIHGHRLAEKVSARSDLDSHVISRIRNESEAKYTNLVYL